MNQIAYVYKYGGYNLRTVFQDGEPWFVAEDVCAILDLCEIWDTVSVLDDDEIGSVTVDSIDKIQDMLTVNESGLFSLIITSNKTQAKSFKKWLSSEVLPAIRKNCSYLEHPPLPQTYSDALRNLLLETERREQLSLKNAHKIEVLKEMHPKAKIYDDIVDSDDLMGIDTAAKQLEIKPRKFRTWLYQMKFLRKDRANRGIPAASMMDKGFMQVKTTPWQNGKLEGVSVVPYFTQPGFLKIKELVDNYNNNTHRDRNILI